jgi:ketosteroid isomerase-like protein
MVESMSAHPHEDLLRRAYSLFNRREIDALLAMMTDDVEWPDVTSGTVLHDKEAIRSYWQGQFSTASPRVEPSDFVRAGEDLVAVVGQQVLDLQGETLVPVTVVFHRYTFEGNLVKRMLVFNDLSSAVSAS